MPREQFACVSALDTSLATHIVRSFVDYCNQFSLNYFLLLVDLLNAFDFAIMEILLGWMQGFSGDQLKHLISLDLSEQGAHELT